MLYGEWFLFSDEGLFLFDGGLVFFSEGFLFFGEGFLFSDEGSHFFDEAFLFYGEGSLFSDEGFLLSKGRFLGAQHKKTLNFNFKVLMLLWYLRLFDCGEFHVNVLLN